MSCDGPNLARAAAVVAAAAARGGRLITAACHTGAVDTSRDTDPRTTHHACPGCTLRGWLGGTGGWRASARVIHHLWPATKHHPVTELEHTYAHDPHPAAGLAVDAVGTAWPSSRRLGWSVGSRLSMDTAWPANSLPPRPQRGGQRLAAYADDHQLASAEVALAMRYAGAHREKRTVT